MQDLGFRDAVAFLWVLRLIKAGSASSIPCESPIVLVLVEILLVLTCIVLTGPNPGKCGSYH